MRRGIGLLAVALFPACTSLPFPGAGGVALGKSTSSFPVAYSESSARGPEPAVANATTATTNPAATPKLSGLKQGAPQRAACAAIVGIERYRDLPAATGARADAEHFGDLARTTLGIPATNVRSALDEHATRTDVQQLLAWLSGCVSPGGRAYFFYSGHGSPDIKDGSAMLVPYDASATTIDATALELEDVYRTLAAMKAKEAIVFLDACFSGAGGRSVIPKDARPLMRIKEAEPTASLLTFASASGSETSSPAKGGGQGVFTKYLVEGLGSGTADIDGDGQITAAELAEWVAPRVTNEARDASREQHPKLSLGSGVGDAKNVAVVWGIK